MKFNEHIKKIMKLFSVMILVFTLSSCSAIFNAMNGSELENRVKSFNDSSNQFEIETTIDLKATYLDQSESFSDSMVMKIQMDPMYTEIKSGNLTVSQFIYEDRIREITVNRRNKTEDITLYEEAIYDYAPGDVNGMILFNFNGVPIKKEGNNQYIVEALFKDFLNKTDQEVFLETLIGSGIDEDDILDSNVKVTFTFESEHLIVSMEIEVEINEILINIKITIDMLPITFQVIDVDNQDKFQKIFTTSDERMTIDLNEEVYYPTIVENHMEYYSIYLEPGVYGFDYNGNYEDIFVQMYKTGDETYMKPFFDFADYENTDSHLKTLYEVKSSGYYLVSLYSQDFIENVTKFKIVQCYDEVPSIETADLVITESGSYTYELDRKMDVFSVYLDLPNETFVSIKDLYSDTAAIIYKYDLNKDVYSVIYHITEKEMNFYINDYNKLIYLYPMNGTLSDEFNIQIRPLDQVTSMDDPNIKDMTDIYSEGYLHSDYWVKPQYMKLEVLEAADYMFSYRIYKGSNVNGNLYDVNGALVIERLSNTDQRQYNRYFLLPGTYYYATSDKYLCVYQIKYTKFVSDIVNHGTIELSGHHEITGAYNENRFFKGAQTSKYQRILYKVVLDSDKYIVHSSHNTIDIFDNENKMVDFISDRVVSGYVTTFVKSGTYTISVKTYNDRLISYSFVFYYLTGITTDDSVNPNYQLLDTNTQGLRVSNYLNDTDGFKIVITERDSYQFISTIDFILILIGDIGDRRVKSESLINLAPGVYYVINYEGYTGTWLFSYKQANFLNHK